MMTLRRFGDTQGELRDERQIRLANVSLGQIELSDN